MFCRNCGKEINEGAVICVNCGFGVGTGDKYCQFCGAEMNPGAQVCMSCGRPTSVQAKKSPKSKLVAGLLGIFLGSFGAHNFYLGFNGKAVAQLILSICTCGLGSIWGFIEGIVILCSSTYKDASGEVLSD